MQGIKDKSRPLPSLHVHLKSASQRSMKALREPRFSPQPSLLGVAQALSEVGLNTQVRSRAHDCAGESECRLWNWECYQRGDNGAFELFRVCLFSATADAVPILTSNLAKAFDQPFRGLNQMT